MESMDAIHENLDYLLSAINTVARYASLARDDVLQLLQKRISIEKNECDPE